MLDNCPTEMAMNDTRVPDTVAALRELIHTSNNIVVFTGAGISTESASRIFAARRASGTRKPR